MAAEILSAPLFREGQHSQAGEFRRSLYLS
jgi:hypothetical protein